MNELQDKQQVADMTSSGFSVRLILISLLYAGVGALADEPKSDQTLSGSQVIANNDGKVLDARDDGADGASFKSAVIPASALNGLTTLIVSSEPEAPQYQANGTVSTKLGLKHLNMLQVDIGENGQVNYSHTPIDAASLKQITTQTTATEQ